MNAKLNKSLNLADKTWGFYGNMAASKRADRAWPLAVNTISKLTYSPEKAAAAFLNSDSYGAHFAQDVLSALNGKTDLPAAVKTTAVKLMSFKLGENTSEILGVPVNTPYLKGVLLAYSRSLNLNKAKS